jgi:prepilin-type processing-associated H-X9-DG protein
LADGATHTITVSENLQAEFWHQSTPNLYQARTVKEYDQILKNRTHRACYSNIMVWWPKPPAGNRLGILNAKLCQLNGQATNDILRDRSPRAFMPYAARPSSNHKGGVTVGFADGHTAFISDGIDYIAYQSLLTPDNAKSSMPNPGYQLSTSDLGN